MLKCCLGRTAGLGHSCLLRVQIRAAASGNPGCFSRDHRGRIFPMQWPCGSYAHDPNIVSSGVKGRRRLSLDHTGPHHHQPALLPPPPCSEQNASPYLSGTLRLVMEQRYPQQSPSLCTRWIWALHQMQGKKQLCCSSTKASLPPEGSAAQPFHPQLFSQESLFSSWVRLFPCLAFLFPKSL